MRVAWSRASRVRAPLAVAALATLLATSTADAHLGGADGVAPFFNDAGALVGAGTTFGLVFESGAELVQTCDEAIAEVIPLAFAQVGSTTLSANAQGVFSTVDNGCNWTPVQGLEGRSVQVLVPSAARADRVWTMSANADGDNVVAAVDISAAELVVNVVHSDSGVLFTSAVVSAAAGDDDVLVVAASVAGTPALFALVGQERLSVEAAALDEALVARVLEVSEGRLFFSTLDRLGRGHLFAADAAAIASAVEGTVVLDAVEIGAFDGLVTATAVFQGSRFATSGSGILHSAVIGEDGGVSAFTRIPLPPLRCLRVHGDKLVGCSQNADSWFVSSSDGQTFAPLMLRDDVGDFACAEGSVAASACAYRFVPDVPDVPDDDDDDDDDNDDASSCAHTGGASAWAWAMVLVPVLLARRRPFSAWTARSAPRR